MKGEWMTEAEFQRRFGMGRFAWKAWAIPLLFGLAGLAIGNFIMRWAQS